MCALKYSITYDNQTKDIGTIVGTNLVGSLGGEDHTIVGIGKTVLSCAGMIASGNLILDGNIAFECEGKVLKTDIEIITTSLGTVQYKVGVTMMYNSDVSSELIVVESPSGMPLYTYLQEHGAIYGSKVGLSSTINGTKLNDVYLVGIWSGDYTTSHYWNADSILNVLPENAIPENDAKYWYGSTLNISYRISTPNEVYT